jgi:hypothetical protein
VGSVLLFFLFCVVFLLCLSLFRVLFQRLSVSLEFWVLPRFKVLFQRLSVSLEFWVRPRFKVLFQRLSVSLEFWVRPRFKVLFQRLSVSLEFWVRLWFKEVVFVLFIVYYNCLYVLSSVLWCPLPFPHKNVLTIWVTWRVLCKRLDLLSIGNRPIFGGSVLIIFLVCVCVFFYFVFWGVGRVSCVSIIAQSLECPFLIASSDFSTIYSPLLSSF